MKTASALVVLILGIFACTHPDQDAAITNLNRDIVRLTRENATLKVRIDNAEAAAEKLRDNQKLMWQMVSDIDARTARSMPESRADVGASAPRETGRPDTRRSRPCSWFSPRGVSGFVPSART